MRYPGDYDGFGPSILNLSVPLDCFVHENGAWRWRRVNPPPKKWAEATHVREALPQEDLKRLRDVLSRALVVVNRQIEEDKV